MPEWMSILPPLLAIAVAIWKKEVTIALLLGIWLGEALLLWHDGAFANSGLALPLEALFASFLAVANRIVGVFSDSGNVQVLLFGLVVGALLELMKDSGGVQAFVGRLSNLGLTSSPRRASVLATLTGVVVFVESSISVLSAGVVGQRLFDRYGLSRARLAFIIDSTSAPICILIMLNAWGAYVLKLLQPYNLANPVGVLIGTIPFNFYPLAIFVIVWYTAISLRVFGPMAKLEAAQAQTSAAIDNAAPVEELSGKARSRYMWAPMSVMIGGMFFMMWYTGQGDFTAGNGSFSVLVSVSLAAILAILLIVGDKVMSFRDSVETVYTGMGKLLPVSTIMLLSFAIGALCKALGTGPFVASFLGSFLPALMVAPLVFITAAVISFTTGTSWGTFAILIPLAMPLGAQLGLPPSFVLSAVLGGGVFGDHCSPISDTTILSSLASGCDHLDHVRTQLPYALTAAAFAVVAYLVVGLVIL